MKYILRILIVIVATVAIICAAYYGINGTLPVKTELVNTTVTKKPATEMHSDKIMIASLTSDDIYLYKTNGNILLSVNQKEFEFNNWGKEFDAIEPQIVHDNFDNDNDKEIVITAAEYKNSDGKYTNCIYYLDPVYSDSGKLSYEVSFFNRSAWSNIIDTTLTESVKQLKLSKKYVQFAINYASVGISYNKETGIATNGYADYFSALCDENKNYLTVSGWSKGAAEYSVTDDNEIIVDVPIMVSYKEVSEHQLAGNLHFQLEKSENGKIMVAPKSLEFIPNKDYPVSDPTKIENGHWSYTEHNADIIIDSNDKNIDWIKYRTAYDPSILTQTISYAPTSTDIRSISDLTITESYIKLVAKPECKFSDAYKKGEFSVILNEGTRSQYDISYTASVSTNKQKLEVLTITFDKPYPKNQIKTININYGAK